MTEESLRIVGKIPVENDRLKSLEKTLEILSLRICSNGVGILLGP